MSGPLATANPPLLRMAGPLVISFWMRAAFTLVDTAYAAYVGDPAVAAIGLTFPFEFLMIAIWVGLSNGFTACLSRAMGAHQGEKIEQYVAATRRLVLLSVPLFTLMGAGIWFVAPRLGLDPAVGRAFQIYGTVLVGGSAFTSFWSILPDSIVKAHQDTRSTMWAGIYSNLLNVTLNTVFVFGFGWGIFGIALSTVIGRFAGLAYALARARHHENRRRQSAVDEVAGRDARPHRRILWLAIPSGLSFALVAVETGIVNWVLSLLEHSTETIAAFSIYQRVSLFMLNPLIAIGVAMLPYAARHFGRRDLAGVRRGVRDAFVATVLYSLVFTGPLMFLVAEPVARFLGESDVTIAYTHFALLLVPLACLTGAPFFICRPVFEAMERGMPGLVMATIRSVVLTLPALWLGIRGAESLGESPIFGVIIGLLAAGAIASVAFLAWMLASLTRGEERAAAEVAAASTEGSAGP